eukprot:scaffold245771_cov71-Attheya_sp.AAC.3
MNHVSWACRKLATCCPLAIIGKNGAANELYFSGGTVEVVEEGMEAQVKEASYQQRATSSNTPFKLPHLPQGYRPSTATIGEITGFTNGGKWACALVDGVNPPDRDTVKSPKTQKQLNDEYNALQLSIKHHLICLHQKNTQIDAAISLDHKVYLTKLFNELRATMLQEKINARKVLVESCSNARKVLIEHSFPYFSKSYLYQMDTSTSHVEPQVWAEV